MIIQPIVDIPEVCSLMGIRHVIISPGSRSAHLTLAFARHAGIAKYIIPDERSAGYIALGLSQSAGSPVALVCTSGTASINFYPAITEAYYQNVPLVVFTADRPAQWIDKNDGQTIRQNDLYKNHIKKGYLFPEDFSNAAERQKSHEIVIDAIKTSFAIPQGPVHINVPIREPFYPLDDEKMVFDPGVKKLITRDPGENACGNEFLSVDEIDSITNKKVAIVAGQHHKEPELDGILNRLSYEKGIPVFSDVIANLNTPESVIRFHDSFDLRQDDLIPDVIITFGRSIISKKLKMTLRNSGELIHFHMQENDYPADTYLSLRRIFKSSPKDFFKELLRSSLNARQGYFDRLNDLNQKTSESLSNFLVSTEFGEFKAFSHVLKKIPEKSVIHLANSMAVRYANILGGKSNSEVYCNRGTSGIDGSNSTALGHALYNKKPNYLLTGDMAFFYDRNAFWHNVIPKNLKIVIFNNHGGGIFRLIDGPAQQPELEQYFETEQKLTARNTALDFNMDYYFCDNESDLATILPEFIKKNDTSAILEIESNSYVNQKVFQAYKSLIKNGT